MLNRECEALMENAERIEEINMNDTKFE